MAKWIDRTGAEWDVAITFAELIRIKKRLGLCLIDLTDEDRAAGKAKADMAKMNADPTLFIDVLFVLLEPQARAKGLDDVSFAGVLDAPSLHAAVDAVDEEITLFFLPCPLKERGREIHQQLAVERRNAMVASVSSGSAGS